MPIIHIPDYIMSDNEDANTSDNDDTATIVDGEDVEENNEVMCNCGLAIQLHHRKYHLLIDIKEAQTALDKMLGQLELINSVLEFQE